MIDSRMLTYCMMTCKMVDILDFGSLKSAVDIQLSDDGALLFTTHLDSLCINVWYNISIFKQTEIKDFTNIFN